MAARSPFPRPFRSGPVAARRAFRKLEREMLPACGRCPVPEFALYTAACDLENVLAVCEAEVREWRASEARAWRALDWA